MVAPSAAARCAYDHRLRELTCQERNPRLFARLGVPRSTAASWLRRGPRAVVSAEILNQDRQLLQVRVLTLQSRNEILLALVRLLFMLVRFSGARLDSDRLPEGASKGKVLDGVGRATRTLSLERPVGFYVQQHNSVMPHSAFLGQMPGEMYFGTGTRLPDDLAAARLLARQAPEFVQDASRPLEARQSPDARAGRARPRHPLEPPPPSHASAARGVPNSK